MRWQIVALGVGVSAACILASACGIELDGIGPAADGGADVSTVDATSLDGGSVDGANVDAMGDAATADGGPPLDARADSAPDSAADAAPDGPIDCGGSGFVCGNMCLTGANACATCPGAPVQCDANRTCGTSCAACAGLPIDCATCAGNGTPTQVCVGSPNSCIVAPQDTCACADGDAGDCPGANQICFVVGMNPGFCGTCGDPSSQGKTCANGEACTQQSGTCQ